MKQSLIVLQLLVVWFSKIGFGRACIGTDIDFGNMGGYMVPPPNPRVPDFLMNYFMAAIDEKTLTAAVDAAGYTNEADRANIFNTYNDLNPCKLSEASIPATFSFDSLYEDDDLDDVMLMDSLYEYHEYINDKYGDMDAEQVSLSRKCKCCKDGFYDHNWHGGGCGCGDCNESPLPESKLCGSMAALDLDALESPQTRQINIYAESMNLNVSSTN